MFGRGIGLLVGAMGGVGGVLRLKSGFRDGEEARRLQRSVEAEKL